MVMKFNRIVAFGCSLTHGHYLPKDPKCTHEYPQGQAWPRWAADQLGWQWDNQAEPGWSNKQIWWSFRCYPWQPGDVALIQWSFINRWSVIADSRSSGHSSFGAWSKNKDSRAYINYFYSEFDACEDLKLRSRDCSAHLGPGHLIQISHPKSQHHNPETIRDLFSIPNILDHVLDRAEDGQHPGILTHKQYGNLIAEQIRANVSSVLSLI
jgi:hypothetical protein